MKLDRLVAVFLLGLALLFLLVIGRGCKGPVRMPEIAGQELPSEGVQIDLDRLVDVYLKPYSGSEQEPRIFRRCRILGIVGEPHVSSSFSSKTRGYFRDWICLEFEDGRRAFTPKMDIEYFIESEAIANGIREAPQKSETENFQ